MNSLTGQSFNYIIAKMSDEIEPTPSEKGLSWKQAKKLCQVLIDAGVPQALCLHDKPGKCGGCPINSEKKSNKTVHGRRWHSGNVYSDPGSRVTK
jgi:hypothetical protein